MICVRTIPTSVIDLNFKPPSWLRWIKLFDAVRNWSLLPMTFLIDLPNVLSRTIGLNDLGKLYDSLLGLGMTTIIDLLKWDGQNPRSIQALAILIILLKQLSSLRMVLRWLHNSLSSPSVEELLQLVMALLNSSLENGVHKEGDLSAISLRMLMLTWQWRVVLNVEWSVFHRSSMVRHCWLLYLIASIADSLHLLT